MKRSWRNVRNSVNLSAGSEKHNYKYQRGQSVLQAEIRTELLPNICHKHFWVSFYHFRGHQIQNCHHLIFDRSSYSGPAGLRAGRSGNRIPLGARYFLFSKMSRGPPSPLFNGYRLFPGGKRPGRELNPSPPSRAENKNEWSSPSTSAICLHGVDRENVFVTWAYQIKGSKSAGLGPGVA